MQSGILGVARLIRPVAAFLAFALALFCSATAFAYPHFARQVGRDCTYCHSLVPKLNETGRAFRANGYRFDAEGEWKEIKDLSTIPASFEVEVELENERIESGNATSSASDLKVEEAEVIAGGAFGKGGKASAIVVMGGSQTDDGFDFDVTQAFLRVNDLIGPEGEGLLNIKAGQTMISLPFIGIGQSPLSARHFTQTALGLFSADERVIELNGIINAEEGDGRPTHRWAIGLSRSDVLSDDKMGGLFATYLASFGDALSVGAILRAGEESNGTEDLSYARGGAAVEAKAGSFLFNAGAFTSRGDVERLDSFVAEGLYKLNSRIGAGARLDVLKGKDKDAAVLASVMFRYNVLSSVYLQAELDALKDADIVAGGNEEEKKLKVFLVALF